MKTLLIVEDEKLIRKGIRTMVLRSGVPVDLILECSNGEEALALLGERPVDVMFTDIRMQRMDGIELVRRASELEHPPLMVAISGFDDFSYAVEMLRSGVREYLLKPVERDKITQILQKLEGELHSRSEAAVQEKEISLQQLRTLLADTGITEEERETIVSRNERLFPSGDYQVVCYPESAAEEPVPELTMRGLPGGAYSILTPLRAANVLMDELSETKAGVSGVHRGLRQLPAACAEALEARGYAFCRGEHFRMEEDRLMAVPTQLKEKARELLTEESRTKRVQILGTDKTEEIIARWRNLIRAAASLQLSVTELTRELDASLSELPKVYRENLTQEDLEKIGQLMHPLRFTDLETYEEMLMDWILELGGRLGARPDDNGVRQKILLAQQYVRENFQSDLNMAVVSNYVSMNYSLFSYSFKQITGSNFVTYLKEIRIREAQRLLAETDMKIIEISQCVGYDNEKHFMKTFKAVCGVSPSEYRKNVNG